MGGFSLPVLNSPKRTLRYSETGRCDGHVLMTGIGTMSSVSSSYEPSNRLSVWESGTDFVLLGVLHVVKLF